MRTCLTPLAKPPAPCACRPFFCLCLFASAAQGFGAQGHRLAIGNLAEQHLSPAALAAVRGILDGESLAAASTWADEMRDSPLKPRFWSYDYAANWHFVNIGPGEDYRRSRKNAGGDAYAALLAFIAILEGRPLPAGPVGEGLALYFGMPSAPPYAAPVKALALRFLLHIAGDLHQPMHVGYEEDRGGNDIDVRWFGEASNLHRVWDSQLLRQAGLSDAAWGRRLMAGAAALPQAGLTGLRRSEPADWLAEGRVLRSEVYDVERFGARFGEAYVETFAPVLERQLLYGGLRLAALLNRIFE